MTYDRTTPALLTEHRPDPGYALVPDCLCEVCSKVRRKWAAYRAKEDEVLLDDELVDSVLETTKPCACQSPHCEDCGPVPWVPAPVVERDIACPLCRRHYCRVLAPENVAITVMCPGCMLEKRR